MKETINVNIGSQAFVLDTDAYTALHKYLDEIRSRMPGEEETMNDIEARIAEILREKVPSPMLVVSLDIVGQVMAQMGSPADFGPQGYGTGENREEESGDSHPKRKLYRSRTDRSIAGVCGGIAEFFDTDPTLLRLITLLLILFGGLSLWVYLILWIIIPQEPARQFNINNKNQ